MLATPYVGHPQYFLPWVQRHLSDNRAAVRVLYISHLTRGRLSVSYIFPLKKGERVIIT